MKTLKLIAIAITAAAVAGPAFAGRDETQIAAQERARVNARKSSAAAGASQAAPASRSTVSLGHPTERVRR